jgi:hypothetical protein
LLIAAGISLAYWSSSAVEQDEIFASNQQNMNLVMIRRSTSRAGLRSCALIATFAITWMLVMLVYARFGGIG